MISSRVFYRYGLVVLLVALVTLLLWLLRDELTLANFSLIYLLVVFFFAIRYGVGPSLLAAFISILCFNFFLVQPLYTFLVSDPREVLDLIVFLIVAVVTGQLAAQARRDAENARERAYEQEIMYRLTSTFNQLANNAEVHDALKRALEEDFAVRQVHILPYTSDATAKNHMALYLLMQSGGEIYGTLRLGRDEPFTPLQSRLINAITIQASMALHRIRLAERARQSETFEEADRLKTALLHAVSHDLRTPITIIKTSASNLLRLYEQLPPDDREEMLKTIDGEADHLNKMVGNLLDLSRLQAGVLQLNSGLNSLEEVVGDVAARAYQMHKDERIKIIFPDDMPLVKFDYGLMLQALTNLVENALRYEPIDSQVEIRGRFMGDEARVEIANHGPNIQPEEREHIMDPFYHGRDGHIGLGLPIARGIVEAHHGSLTAEDTLGGGATFVLSLPLEPESVKVNHENSSRG